jgi:hypothetical protein
MPLLAGSPAQLTFGSEPIGAPSVPLAATIANPGTAIARGLTLKASGDFAITASGCGPALAAGESCNAQLEFTPTAPGARTGSLTISGASLGLKPASISLTGTGQAQGSLAVNVSNLVFGATTIGRGSEPQLATVANTSQSTAAGLTYKTSGDFSIEDNTCGPSLAASQSCTMDIVFTPRSAGARTGSMTASSTTAGVAAAQVALSGTGVPAAYLAATPAMLSFPATPTNLTSSALRVTLSNPGIAAAGGLNATATGDFSATVCATRLAPGANCDLNVFFTPSGTGVRSGVLTLSTTAAGAAPVTVALLGSGSVPPSISLTPGSRTFPATIPGETTAAQSIVVSNPGASPLNAPTLAVTGDFQLASNTCIGTLAAGGSCKVQIVFAPIEAGGRAGTLTVSSSTSGVSPATATLQGIGLTPSVITVSPPQIVFPVVLTGQSSAPQTVTISNAGGTAIDSLTLAVSSQFALTANKCAGSMAVGKSCTVGVYFKPIAQGAVTGALTITSPSVNIPAVVALSGTGGAPAAILVQPALITFQTTGVGQTSNPQTVTITNAGTARSLAALAFKIGAGFRMVNNACTSTLAPAASCTVGIEFTPSSAGARQATLAVSSTGAPRTSVTLLGTGFDFTATLQGTTSLTIASGQTGSFTLSIKPLGGSPGSFTFQCGAVPASTVCLFSPPSESVSAGATGTVVAQLETGTGSTAVNRSAPTISRAWPIALGILLIPFALRKRRTTLLLVALAAIVCGAVSSCVSASGGLNVQHPIVPGVTPPGTYSIPVTVAAYGVSHKVTLSLTVD